MSTPSVTSAGVRPPAVSVPDVRCHCGHCGQLVIGSRVPGDQGEAFCCEGCRAVHKWLNASRLEGYYDLLEQSGKRAPQAFPGEEYQAFLESLDRPGVLAGVGRWQDSRHALTLACGEISCAGCGWLLERLTGRCPWDYSARARWHNPGRMTTDHKAGTREEWLAAQLEHPK